MLLCYFEKHWSDSIWIACNSVTCYRKDIADRAGKSAVEGKQMHDLVFWKYDLWRNIDLTFILKVEKKDLKDWGILLWTKNI